MGTYRPLYSLRVEHDYYDNLACRALAFRLKAGGVDLCRRRGLLFRQTAVNEWTLLYDCDSAGVDTSSDKVEAELCITDPAFVLFTDWAALRPRKCLYPGVACKLKVFSSATGSGRRQVLLKYVPPPEPGKFLDAEPGLLRQVCYL